MTHVLGLPVEQALSELSRCGVTDVKIIESIAPRGGRTDGTMRVICFRDAERLLIVSRFRDEVDAGKGAE